MTIFFAIRKARNRIWQHCKGYSNAIYPFCTLIFLKYDYDEFLSIV